MTLRQWFLAKIGAFDISSGIFAVILLVFILLYWSVYTFNYTICIVILQYSDSVCLYIYIYIYIYTVHSINEYTPSEQIQKMYFLYDH